MKNLWDDHAAQDAVKRWDAEHAEDFALRLYTARLIGQDPRLVLHGGGNVSVKQPHRTILGDEIEVVYVKGSGCDLAALEPDGMPGIDLAHLRRLRDLSDLGDEAMVNEIRTHLLDASAPTPSIETLLHAFCPHRFVDHSHADAVLALTNQPDGEQLIRGAIGQRVAIVPYVVPGFQLAKAVADVYESDPSVEGIVLLQHGLVTFADDAKTSYDRHIAIVDACEKYIAENATGPSLTPSFRTGESPDTLASMAAPLLRGLLAHPTGDEDHPFVRSILEWRGGDGVMAFVNSEQARELATTGPLTTDHLIRTKPYAMYVAEPAWSDAVRLSNQLKEAVENYRNEYSRYVTKHGGIADTVDPAPLVVLLPGAGAFCWGRTKRDAGIAADITEQTLATKAVAHAIGRYTPLAPEHLFAMEYRSIQRAKLQPTANEPLEGQVVMISGGAGAIGAAIAEVCIEAGAHVVITDINADQLKMVVAKSQDPQRIHGLLMDVTDETSVRAGFEEACRVFGGVDIVVPNAGVAHACPLERLEVDDFQRVMDINVRGYMLFMREGVRILKRQALGGHIVINASKNVFGPGKDFGAYSASKAAGHQLGKVAAIELAGDGIRVNMINADAVFSHNDIPSGLWAHVGPERAASRGMKLEDLPDYYRSRNLLKARVTGRHVGNAVVFFASNATPTTGATLPVDGGVTDAFPR